MLEDILAVASDRTQSANVDRAVCGRLDHVKCLGMLEDGRGVKLIFSLYMATKRTCQCISLLSIGHDHQLYRQLE